MIRQNGAKTDIIPSSANDPLADMGHPIKSLRSNRPFTCSESPHFRAGLRRPPQTSYISSRGLSHYAKRQRRRSVLTKIFPFDLAWDVDSQTVASNLFASSIIPYAGFLYHLQKSKKAPRLTLIGFRFLLVFVLATIIAGVYAKLHYNSVLANVDWLHGSAESFLTITNLLIVLGLRQGIQDARSLRDSPEVDKATSLKEESEAMK